MLVKRSLTFAVVYSLAPLWARNLWLSAAWRVARSDAARMQISGYAEMLAMERDARR